MTNITIDEPLVNQRLDQLLADRLEISRSQAKQAAQDGLVMVDDKPGKAHQRFKLGQTVSWDEAAIKAQSPTAPPPRPDIKLNIVHQDESLVVINKQSGLNMHPAKPTEDTTLANALLAQFPQIADVGESVWRPGIMQRLDKEASGLVVIALTAAAYDKLKDQFQNHTVHKEYLALVEGQPSQESGTIDFPIGRSSRGYRMAARPTAGEKDREAITHYEVLEHLPDRTLVKVRTETGRTHQIRVHFKALGCPLVGDELYGKTGPKPALRLFLHATKLGFRHPDDDRPVEFESPLPPELEQYLAGLRH
jgi:23S rRNA pseudouridine1911/1915/1917 synthase